MLQTSAREINFPSENTREDKGGTARCGEWKARASVMPTRPGLRRTDPGWLGTDSPGEGLRFVFEFSSFFSRRGGGIA